MSDYTREEIVLALKWVGLTDGDCVFTHGNVGFFGALKGASHPQDFYQIFKEAVFSVIGVGGTWVVPAFSYSFCHGEVFDPAVTSGVGGLLAEELRKDPTALRSDDANFSVSAIGKNAEYFTKDPPEHSFGQDSFWDKFLKQRGKFCNFNFDAGSTFIHYVEKKLQVPYRYDKAFPGILRKYGLEEKKVFYHFVRALEKPEHEPDFVKFDRKAKELRIARVVNLGKGQIIMIPAQAVFDLIELELKKNPTFLIAGESL